MADAEPELAELIRRALESRLAQVRVSMPGVIVSYDATTKTATVQPALSDVVFDDDDERVVNEIPPIQNVPVAWPACGVLSIHGNLAEGDTGDLVFATNSISDWQRSGQVAAPGNLRLHPLGSAKFYPGLRHDKNTLPDADDSIGTPGGLRARFAAGAVTVSSDAAGTLAQGAVLETLLIAMLNAVLGAGVTAGGPGAANFSAAVSALGSYALPLSGKLKAEP